MCITWEGRPLVDRKIFLSFVVGGGQQRELREPQLTVARLVMSYHGNFVSCVLDPECSGMVQMILECFRPFGML